MRTHEERTREPNINSKHQKLRKNEERPTTNEEAENEAKKKYKEQRPRMEMQDIFISLSK